MARARALAPPSRGHQSGEIKSHPFGKGCGRLRQFFSCSTATCGFLRRQCQLPNTPNLRQLQDKAALDEILAALQGVQSATPESPPSSGARASSPASTAKPILV